MSGNPLKGSKMNDIKLNSIESAIEDIKSGKIIIVVDDEDRENEGDFICAAECVTPEHINFMATHGRGLICTPLDEIRAEELELDMMVKTNTALHETAFTVSIDLIGYGCSTGISAYDRATGIRKLVDPTIKSSDYARPGHIFPLKAKTGGVLRRTGHTEAAIDLARLAGFYPAGVLVEILNEDGTMARLKDLIQIANKFNLKIISIADLIAYRLKNEKLIKKVVENTFSAFNKTFKIIGYEQITTGDIHLAIVLDHWNHETPVLVRVHSTNDSDELFSSILNERSVLHKSLEMIASEGFGAILIMRHIEKNTGIIERIESIQENDHKTDMSQRDFGVGAQILRDLNIRKIKLMTNNPKKRIGLMAYDIEIVENIKI
jgi:3,4-dihydroxy 2-butanone 4-phosphate synthase / GTP cyclohydrolase II